MVPSPITQRRRLDSRQGWEEFAQSTFQGHYDATLATSHSWSFSDTDGAAVNAVSGAQDFWQIPCGIMYEGDQSAISFEQRTITGAAPILGFQRSADGGTTWSDVIATYTLNATTEHHVVTAQQRVTPAISGQTFRWIVGLGTSGVGQFVCRNLLQSVILQNQRTGPVRVVDTRQVTLTKTSGTWAAKSGYANDDCVVTVSGSDLVITWATAMPSTAIPSSAVYGAAKPQAQALLDYANNGYKRKIYAAGVDTTNVHLRFWTDGDTTNSPLDPTSTVDDGTIVHLTVTGYHWTNPLA